MDFICCQNYKNNPVNKSANDRIACCHLQIFLIVCLYSIANLKKILLSVLYNCCELLCQMRTHIYC